jgi:hypothetical protein
VRHAEGRASRVHGRGGSGRPLRSRKRRTRAWRDGGNDDRRCRRGYRILRQRLLAAMPAW